MQPSMSNKRGVEAGLEKLLYRDNYLLKIDVNERSITHRLAMYYQEIFPKWDVDCEYNRRRDKPKDIRLDIEDLLARMAVLLRERQYDVGIDLMCRMAENDSLSEEMQSLEQQLFNPELEYDPERDLYLFLLRLLDGKTIIKKLIVPDIVIHKRGKKKKKKKNYIAIEAKKTSGPSIASREYDILKLQALIKDERYKYKYGYFIELPVLQDLENFEEFSFASDPFEEKVTLVSPVYL